MANLAIRGHIDTGWRVIKTLEMLGGVNKFNLEGNTDDWYVLTDTGVILYCEMLFDEKGFTLKEFLERFPYKVGDRVRVPEYESEVCISKMYWDGSEVQYEVVTDEVEWYSAKELNEFNEPNKKETAEKENYNPISLLPVGDKIMIVPTNEDSEIIEENGKIYLVKKQPKYPKTYEECCRIIDYHLEGTTIIGYNKSLLENFQKLLICRDAYWKIAGEQMGLGKPWEPDWDNEDKRNYVITCQGNNIIKDVYFIKNTILAFPTEEMRDAFQKNFWVLIELCKELL